MSKCPRLAPTGILDLKYSPFIPLYFHMSYALTPFSPWVFSSVQSSTFFFYYMCFSLTFTLARPCLSPYPSIYISVSFPRSLSICPPLYLSVSLLYTRARTQTKASHVGMHVQQIWRWLCGSRDELVEKLHSSLIRWHTHSLIKTIILSSSLHSPSRQSKVQEKVVFYAIGVSPLVSWITKGSE